MMHSLQTKIFVFFMALLLAVMMIILLIVYRTTYTHTQAQIAAQLASGYAVVQNELETRKRYVGNSSRTITKDFSLIEQVVSRDANSIAAALDSYRSRAGASFSVVTDLDGGIIASTQADLMVGQKLPFGQLTAGQLANSQTVYGIYHDHAYQVFIWPLYAPEPNQIACLVMGYMLDDNLTLRLKKLTDLDVSFMQPGKVFASSLAADDRALLTRTDIKNTAQNSWRTLDLDGLEYVTYSALLPVDSGKSIIVFLQRSLTDALRDYKSLQLQLIATQLVSLLLAALGAFAIASSITSPLRRMSAYVKRIAAGEYSEPLPDDNSKGEIGVLAAEFAHMQREITEREASILHLAYHDALTNLANRNDFQRCVQTEVEAAKHSDGRVAVFVMDLDNFSDINVTLGHLSGDFLLKKTAERLERACRTGDYVARLGGDEFAVLVSGFANMNDVIQSILHYRQIFNEAFEVEGISLTVNATIGVAIYPEHAENSGTLMQRAEVAMYIDKRKKMPYSIYNSSQDHHSVLRLALMSELKSAIAQDELVLFYQPKLELASHSITAVECLVRWVHPVHGFISPDDFIPLAEQTGNIRLLTRWIIRAACAQNQAWREQHIDLKTCVNISAVDLLDPQFFNYVAEQLHLHQLPAQALVLEVTESAVMDDPDKAIAILSQFNAMGVGLSIDDYGTGYSSMAQLKRLPVHELKIDKSFVLDVVNSSDDLVIVRSTIELAHNMHLKVVAEGVETQAALSLLQELGCDVAQGYYLSKPIAIAAFEQWLASTQYTIPRLA